MTIWFSWQTKEKFDIWHQSVILGLGLPIVGFNQATGEPEPANMATIAYTDVHRVAENDWRAYVENEIAHQFPDGLGTESSEPNWRNL